MQQSTPLYGVRSSENTNGRQPFFLPSPVRTGAALQRVCQRAICGLLLMATAFGGASVAFAAAQWADSNVRPRTSNGQTVQSERDEQAALFNYYFGDRELTYETTLSSLKTEASVPAWRIPYSAAIHPETSGGLSGSRTVASYGLFGRRRGSRVVSGGSSALTVYDQAFNGGQGSANAYESNRLTSSQQGLFGRRTVSNSESWEGYCSGFTASTIRHPEPVRSVDAASVGGTAGVVFRPSDIKALLSCIYNRTTPDSYLFLAPPTARDGGPNMGTFHLTLANYIGAAGHPVGYDRTKGEVAWNFPIYAYRVNSMRDAGSADGLTYKQVETTVTYSDYGSDSSLQTDMESGNRVGNNRKSMTFRYVLALDENGQIVGGRATSESGHFLWIPLYAIQATQSGSVPGNPYLDMRKVIALARAASLPEVQTKFDAATIGPRFDPAVETPSGEQPESEPQPEGDRPEASQPGAGQPNASQSDASGHET